MSTLEINQFSNCPVKFKNGSKQELMDISILNLFVKNIFNIQRSTSFQVIVATKNLIEC